MNKHKHLAKRYVSLMERASNSIGRKEAISLLHKAEKIRLKMASTEELEVFYHLDDSDPYFASYRKIKKKWKMSEGKYIPFNVENPPITPSRTNCWPIANLIAINISTLVLYYYGGLAGMGLFRGRDINKKTTEDMYYLQSLQVQHDKFLCHHPYLSVSSKAYSSRRSSH